MKKLTKDFSEETDVCCCCTGCGKLLGVLGKNSKYFAKCSKCGRSVLFLTDDYSRLTVYTEVASA